MNIPREGDMMRYYIQLSEDPEFVDPKTGRVNKARANPDRLMETAGKIFQPYHLKMLGEPVWWTIYISRFPQILVKYGLTGILRCQLDSVSLRVSPWKAGSSSLVTHATPTLPKLVSGPRSVSYTMPLRRR